MPHTPLQGPGSREQMRSDHGAGSELCTPCLPCWGLCMRVPEVQLGWNPQTSTVLLRPWAPLACGHSEGSAPLSRYSDHGHTHPHMFTHVHKSTHMSAVHTCPPMSTYIHTCPHMSTYVYIYHMCPHVPHVHIYPHIHMSTHTYQCPHTPTHVHTHLPISTCTHPCSAGYCPHP